MKNLLLFLSLAVFTIVGKAQQPIFAPDFTFTDWYGDTVHLYQHTDSGKVVFLYVLDPSIEADSNWIYYNSGHLQQFYAAHANYELNDAMLIVISNADYEHWVGCCDSESPGNWIELSPFPIIDLGAGAYISNLLTVFGIENQFWNKIFRICPDRSITRLDYLPTAVQLEQEMSGCTFATEANDAKLLALHMDNRPMCASESRDVSVKVSNFGTDTLHTLHITLQYDTATLLSYDWSGDLPTYNSTDISLGSIVGNGDTMHIVASVSNPNGQADPLPSNDTLIQVLLPSALWSEDTIFVDIMTDGYGPQFYWDIKTEDGITIDSGGNVLVGMLDGNGAPIDVGTSYNDFSHITKKVYVGNHGQECLTIRVLSGYGYGICCQYGSGYARFETSNETVFEFTDFGRRAYGKLFTTFDALPPLTTSYAVTHETDGQANGSIAVTASGGVPPYEYSKDCGETFGTAATFENLSQGWYCMRTHDAVGQLREDSVYVDNIVGTREEAIREVVLHPNPARDVLQVSITAGTNTAATLSVVNAVGQVVWQQNMSWVGGQQTVTVPTANLSEGVYWLMVHDSTQTVYQRFVVLR